MKPELPTVSLQTEAGHFTVRYHECATGKGLSLSMGSVDGGVPVVRVQSSCVFSESFHSVTCDCALQLQGALRAIAQDGNGVLVYLYEEGRGAGLSTKIRAMALEEQDGIDTVEAFRRLGLAPDLRDYRGATTILHELGVSSQIALITNNPAKQHYIEAAGFKVERIITLTFAVNPDTAAYLRMKRDRLGHVYISME
ncbi:MAG: GTP cyclohydrolase II [Chloroflexi bacterium]|nr:GTP cyclohydrolase II [Chloroflexota bacterium]